MLGCCRTSGFPNSNGHPSPGGGLNLWTSYLIDRQILLIPAMRRRAGDAGDGRVAESTKKGFSRIWHRNQSLLA
jgi:hypothetical protein